MEPQIVSLPEINILADMALLRPEIAMALGAMALLMLGVFRGKESSRLVSSLAALLLVSVASYVAWTWGPSAVAFGGSFAVDEFASFAKILILAGSALAILMAQGFLRSEKLDRFEFPVLIVIAALGMMMMVSANDLIALYMGIELQSLALYVLAAFNRDSQRATESGVKYFVLGALSSGLLLYGCSLIYGFTGTTNFGVLADVLTANEAGIGVIFGLTFLMAGLVFKISAVPFHMWTPDVYEGAPTPVTAFLAAAPKVAAFALIIRVLSDPLMPLVDEWRQIIIFVSIASMVLGAFAAIGQTNIKRLMAYSTIGHMGYALVGLAAGSAGGIKGVLIYMAIYMITNIGTFVVILSMRRKEGMVEDISDLAGLSRTQPLMAFALAAFLFSLAGIPPLAGFFGKLYVFIPAVEAGLWWLAVIGVVTSVVGAFYYLRIIKIMYFDDPAPAFERVLGTEMRLILLGSTAVVLLFVVIAGPVAQLAGQAAASLLG